MLRIYDVLLDLVREVKPLVETLERRDPDLARQCRKALASAPLNVAEGSHSRGRNRGARYSDVLGSLREAWAAFEVAEAFGYMPPLRAETVARFNHVIGTLVRVVGAAQR